MNNKYYSYIFIITLKLRMANTAINRLTNIPTLSAAMVRKSALFLIVVWGVVLALACWFAFGVYMGSSLKIPNTWQLLFVSALLAPGIAYYVINPFLDQADSKNAIIREFVYLNLGQLKTYIIGIVLTMLVIGVAVIILAATWGLLLNSFLLISDFWRESA